MVYSSISNIKTTELASHRTVIPNHGCITRKYLLLKTLGTLGFKMKKKKNLYITHKYCGVQSGVHFIIYEH